MTSKRVILRIINVERRRKVAYLLQLNYQIQIHLIYVAFMLSMSRSQCRIFTDSDRIVLLSLLMAESGIHAIAYAFPQVKILTTAFDPEIDEHFHIIPGIGNFGDRYFGTDD